MSLRTLVPTSKPTKQQRAAASIEDLSTKFEDLSNQFDVFQSIMKKVLDKWSDREAWQMTTNESFKALL